MRFTPPDLEKQRRQRIETALAKKLPKLAAAKIEHHATESVLVLESDDIALANRDAIGECLREVLRDRADVPDTIYLAETDSGLGCYISVLKKGDDVRKGDRLSTNASGALGVTFDDETTFSLSANASITVDEFVYRKGARGNAVVTVARGTVGFVAEQVAKTGEMRITTPTAIVGVRGTTGVVEVAPGGVTNVKLYEDENGTVGRIEIFNRQGQRIAELTQAATGYAIQVVAQRHAGMVVRQGIDHDAAGASGLRGQRKHR